MTDDTQQESPAQAFVTMGDYHATRVGEAVLEALAGVDPSIWFDVGAALCTDERVRSAIKSRWRQETWSSRSPSMPPDATEGMADWFAHKAEEAREHGYEYVAFICEQAEAVAQDRERLRAAPPEQDGERGRSIPTSGVSGNIVADVTDLQTRIEDLERENRRLRRSDVQGESEPRCPKCGSGDINAKWYDECDAVSRRHHECDNTDEHLCRTCRNCGYGWDDAVPDAMTDHTTERGEVLSREGYRRALEDGRVGVFSKLLAHDAAQREIIAGLREALEEIADNKLNDPAMEANRKADRARRTLQDEPHTEEE